MFAPGFAPYAASENLVNSKLALAMLNRGWDVTVISRCDRGFNYGVEWTEPWLPLRDFTHEVDYGFGGSGQRFGERVYHSLRLGHPIAGVRWAWRALELALSLHREKAFDLVLSRSISCCAHLPALSFVRQTSVPWIANWNDPPGYWFPPPYEYQANALRQAVWNRYYRDVMNTADINTFPCERLARYVSERLGIKERKNISIIPHIGLDTEVTPPAREPGESVFRLCHAGNLSRERNPALFLRALKRLVETDAAPNRIQLDIIGVENVELGTLIRETGLTEHVTFTGTLSYMKTLERLASGTVQVILEAPCPTGIFLPSKFTDYVQTGRPVLAVSPARGTMNDLLAFHGGGLAVDCTSAGDIFAGLQTLYGQWQAGILDRHCSSFLWPLFAPDGIIERYAQILSEIQKGRSVNGAKSACKYTAGMMRG
ncbi:hypothetical protein DENIS_3188 [Desulfonema ishimotonii]|uniref:Glycosyltransferase subfamily 4-like N-terminal domain-containing protein n=2 Tax=Desulfonema ishimotonii TaxID=45657 RepID=A0A401FZ16_9BACT|nr:hypothetical protein DENIS_3188 [Desulfonema ishimotonii]